MEKYKNTDEPNYRHIETKYQHTTKCNATLSIYKADKTGHNYVHMAPADNSSFDADPSSWYANNNLHYKSIFWYYLLILLIYIFLSSVLYKLIILYYMLVFRPFMVMLCFLLQYDFFYFFFPAKTFFYLLIVILSWYFLIFCLYMPIPFNLTMSFYHYENWPLY